MEGVRKKLKRRQKRETFFFEVSLFFSFFSFLYGFAVVFVMSFTAAEKTIFCVCEDKKYFASLPTKGFYFFCAKIFKQLSSGNAYIAYLKRTVK